MIRKICDRCDEVLEFDDEYAGKKVECPHCGDTNILPDATVTASAAKKAEAVHDRAVEAGFPPDSGPEVEVMKIRPSMWRSHPFWTVFTLGIATFFMWLNHLGECITVTNKRTIHRTGFFSKSTTEVLHDHVRNIAIEQGFVNRVFKVGHVGIASSGHEGIEIDAHHMPHPDDIKYIIDLYRPM